MNAFAFKIFGENEFASRLPSALSALLGIAAAGLFGAYVFGRRAGTLAAVLTGASLLYFAIGTLNLTDMMVSAFITVAAASFYTAARSRDKRWYLLFYAAMALATLTKGLIGVVLPGGIAFWYVVCSRKWRLALSAMYVPGALLFLIITLPWFYLVCRDNPDFFRFFFIQEHFLRYATTMHDRYEPFWFFLPLIVAGVTPWTGFLVSLCAKNGVLRSPGSSDEKDANIFLLLWFGIILLFFSISGSKLAPYIVPCLPPLAVMMAANMERMLREGRWIGNALWWSMGINALFAAAFFLLFLLSGKFGRGDALFLSVLSSAGLISGPLSAYVCWAAKKDISRAVFALCAGAFIFTLSLQAVYIPLAKTRSAFGVAEAVRTNKLPGEKIAVYGETLYGVPFYAKERTILVDYTGEMEYGAAHEDDRSWFPGREEFMKRWDAGEPLALIIRKKRMGDLYGESETFRETHEKKTMYLGEYAIIFNREN
jgi:4-amino-4-deoxy-L-arabinose transferase-like glycosyltransferase